MLRSSCFFFVSLWYDRLFNFCFFLRFLPTPILFFCCCFSDIYLDKKSTHEALLFLKCFCNERSVNVFLIANSVAWLNFEQRRKSNFLRRILFCFEWLSQSYSSFPLRLGACTILNMNSDSKPGRKSNAFTHHTVVGVRYLRLLSCPLFFSLLLSILLMCVVCLIFDQHQRSQYLAHLMYILLYGTCVRQTAELCILSGMCDII